MKEQNFKEIKKVEDANKVDLKRYTFVKFSDTRDCYIFKRRMKSLYIEYDNE